MKKKILVKLSDVKRRISVKSHDKFSDLPAKLGTSIQGNFCRGAYLKYRDTPLGTGLEKADFLAKKTVILRCTLLRMNMLFFQKGERRDLILSNLISVFGFLSIL
jgi:hypothetical protein